MYCTFLSQADKFNNQNDESNLKLQELEINEIRLSINFQKDESNLKLQELEKKVYRFFLPNEQNHILNSLLGNLISTRSNKILYFLQKDFFSRDHLSLGLVEYYDFKGQISNELMDFVLQHFFQDKFDVILLSGELEN